MIDFSAIVQDLYTRGSIQAKSESKVVSKVRASGTRKAPTSGNSILDESRCSSPEGLVTTCLEFFYKVSPCARATYDRELNGNV